MAAHKRQSDVDEKRQTPLLISSTHVKLFQRPSEEEPAADAWPYKPHKALFRWLVVPLTNLCICVIVGLAVWMLIGEVMDWTLVELQVLVGPPPFKHQVFDPSWPYSRPQVGARTARPPAEILSRSASSAGGNTRTTPLQAFSVDVPLLGLGGKVVGAGTSDGYKGIQTIVDGTATAAGCQVTLAVEVFATSFGAPFVGRYSPPDCLKHSNTAIMNLTVKSQGRQFDRLAFLYLGDTEIFRTSTAQPRQQGISYTYMKDMSQYMALWKQPQTVIFDLPNLVDPNRIPPLTGTFNTTLTVSFFTAPDALVPADTIIPLSARQSNNGSQPSVFTIPNEENSTASTIVAEFPRNAARAVITVLATGQGEEEFWWANVLQSAVLTYKASINATLTGFSPFREVQLLIDGQLAGVQWPFPIIFTGGVAPSLWSPMVGIDAFDLKEGEVDISPWLGVLCDGRPHNFSVNVVGLNDDGVSANLSSGVASNWKISGKIFVWLDHDSESITTGPPPTITGLQPTIAVSQSITKNATGANDTLQYTTYVNRALSIQGSITTSTGKDTLRWEQSLIHTDAGFLTNLGSNQLNTITTRGTDMSNHPVAMFNTTYSYPLSADVTSEVLKNGTTRINAILSRTKNLDRTVGEGLVAPSGLQLFAALPRTASLVSDITGTSLSTVQSGQAVLLIAPNGTTTGFGSNAQKLHFWGESRHSSAGEAPVELYLRNMSVNSSGKVLGDAEKLAGMNIVSNRPPAAGAPAGVM